MPVHFPADKEFLTLEKLSVALALALPLAFGLALAFSKMIWALR